MPTLNDVDLSYLYIMMKGEPGTRKSTSALSFPRPQYWFSFDQKMEALIKPMRAWNIDPKEITFDDYKDWTGAKKKLEALQLNCPYKTVVLDSITSIGDAINRQTLKAKGASDQGKKVGGTPVNSIEDFNAESACFQELVALTKDIHKFHKVNVILIAHVIQTEQKSPDGKTHMSRLIVTGGKKIAAKIPAYCTEVYHFNIESGFVEGQGGQYALLTEHTGDDFARTSLSLNSKILFGSDPLYDKYIKPAIDKTQNTPNTVKAF